MQVSFRSHTLLQDGSLICLLCWRFQPSVISEGVSGWHRSFCKDAQWNLSGSVMALSFHFRAKTNHTWYPTVKWWKWKDRKCSHGSFETTSSLKFGTISRKPGNVATWQRCYMTTGQLNWVDEVWETCKFAKSRGSQIIPQPLKLHLPSTETLGYFRTSVRKTVTPLRGNKIQVSCHILTHSCSLWNTLHSWPTVQNQIILLIAIIVPTETTNFLFICFFQVQLRNKSREET